MASKATERGSLLTRGAFAARTGCSIETIRYYEQIGILPPPLRTGGGHRLYGEGFIKRLTFILRSRDLGFTLEEIRELLRMVDGRNYTCAQVDVLAQKHLLGIRRKISALKRLKSTLETMTAQCSRGQIPECPIIDALFEARMPLRPVRAMPKA